MGKQRTKRRKKTKKRHRNRHTTRAQGAKKISAVEYFSGIPTEALRSLFKYALDKAVRLDNIDVRRITDKYEKLMNNDQFREIVKKKFMNKSSLKTLQTRWDKLTSEEQEGIQASSNMFDNRIENRRGGWGDVPSNNDMSDLYDSDEEGIVLGPPPPPPPPPAAPLLPLRVRRFLWVCLYWNLMSAVCQLLGIPKYVCMTLFVAGFEYIWNAAPMPFAGERETRKHRRKRHHKKRKTRRRKRKTRRRKRRKRRRKR